MEIRDGLVCKNSQKHQPCTDGCACRGFLWRHRDCGGIAFYFDSVVDWADCVSLVFEAEVNEVSV